MPHSQSLLSRLETQQRILLQILRLANSPDPMRDLVRAVTGLLQEWSGCQAVGVRLADGDDFPYFETRGFPAEFVAAETHLCALNPSGEVLRDSQGNPVLECMCGNILRGRVDPSKPFFTPHGSFWSNCTTDLLAATSESDRQGRTRNRCNGEGYESVALVPLRSGGTIIGLLQFNDRRKGRFTPESIALLEQLAESVAMAIAHRRALEALQASETRNRQVINNLSEGIWIIDRDARTSFVTERMARMLGYTEAEMIGKGLFDFMDPQAALSCRHNLERRREGIREVHDFEFLRKDGSRMYAQLVAAPILDERGQYGGAIAGVMDVTERRQAEIDSRKSALNLAMAAQIAHVGYWDRDPVSGRIELSAEAWRIAGLEPHTGPLDIRAMFELIHPDDRDWVAQVIARANEGIRPDNLDFRIVRPDGTVRFVHTDGQAWLDESGRPVRLFGVVADITESRQAAERLLNYQEQLRELALRLATAEEQERRRIAVDFHDRIGQNVAALRMNLQVLRRAPLPPDAAAALTEALDLLKQMGDDSRTLLFELCPPLLYDIGLGAAIGWLVENLAARNDLPFRFRGGHLGSSLRNGRGAALYQAVRELLGNAAKHAHATQVDIDLTEPPGQIRIRVRDNGVGFDPARLEHGGPERGFGLFWIREHLHFLGGQLDIASNPGHGCTITLTVPALEAPGSP